MDKKHFVSVLFALLLAFLVVTPARAHQPYFETADLMADRPWRVKNPRVSTAIYATLDSSVDVDYFAFDGKTGDKIYLAMTIPQIKGQEEFAPGMALLGPGFPEVDLPARVTVPAEAGGFLLAPPDGPASAFHEPFSNTDYWSRQERIVSLPADGRYLVAVWHPQGHTGRYVFVVGQEEKLGGDWLFPFKMRAYWKPVLGVQPYHCHR